MPASWGALRTITSILIGELGMTTQCDQLESPVAARALRNYVDLIAWIECNSINSDGALRLS